MSAKDDSPNKSIEEVRAFFEERLLGAHEHDSREEILAHASATLWYLNWGEVRIWDPATDTVQGWCKRAILEYFRVSASKPMESGCFEYHDKLPMKKMKSLQGVRVVPGAIARYSSYIEPGAILMPSFINVGARVGEGTLIDTWATVGSCAQIGRNVHVSGGVGIGGVLEPPQAHPVIIEDGAFLGSRVVVVEGVRVGHEAVLGAGVILTASSKIIDVRKPGTEPTFGRIPPRSVVIPGTVPKVFPAGEFQVPCALIIGTRSHSTNLKTSLNETLREHSVAI